MAPTITTNKDLIFHYNGYLSTIASATTTASDLSPYVASSIQVDESTLSIEEYRNIVPPDTAFNAELFVADVESRTLAVRVRSHVEAVGLKMLEHVFYEFDDEWKIRKVVRLFAKVGEEVPDVGN